MRQKSVHPESSSERLVKNIRRATRKRHSSEEKIRIVLDGLRGESSIAELCRREGIAESLYYAWSKEFLEAGKRRLAGDTVRAATSGEVKDLRREAQELKAVVAEQASNCVCQKKHDRGWGKRGMRYPASEKLEIIRLVEQSHLPVRWTLAKLGIQPARFYRWYDRLQTGGPEALEDKSPSPSASGTASRTQYASGLFSWRWMSRSYPHGNWPRASPISRLFCVRGFGLPAAQAHDLITSPA